jgi:hypothetical protein
LRVLHIDGTIILQWLLKVIGYDDVNWINLAQEGVHH